MYFTTDMERVEGVVASLAGEASHSIPVSGSPRGEGGTRDGDTGEKLVRKINSGGQRCLTSGETKVCYMSLVFRRPPPNLTTP